MSDAISRLLQAHHQQLAQDASTPIRLPGTDRTLSWSPGSRRSLRPGGEAVIRVEVRDPSGLAPWASLTPRQFEVLEHLVEGSPTKVICRCLDMSEGTAKVHITAILRALNVRNRSEAVLAALRAGWIQTVVSKTNRQEE